MTHAPATQTAQETGLAQRRQQLVPQVLETLLGMADFYFLTDATGVLLDYRARDEKTLYRPPEAFLGKRVTEVLPGDIGARFQRYLDRALHSADTLVFSYGLPGPTGEHDFEAQVHGLADRLGCVTIVTDVTRREQMSRALAEQEALAKTMFEQTTDAIVLVDPATGRFVDCNNVACRQLGYHREELKRRGVVDIQAEHAPEEIAANLTAILQGAVLGFETRHRRKDGSLFEVDVSFRCLEHGGRQLICCVWRDITEQRRTARELDAYRQHLEEMVAARTRELEAAKRLADAANHAKSAFLSNISHEIRTPMNAILGFAHLLRQDPLTAKQSAHLEKLSNAAGLLMQLINDLIDLSSIEAERLELTDDDFDLSRVLDQVASQVAPVLVAKGLELVMDLDQVPLALRGDAARLRQILLNLLGNAVKFTSQGEVGLRLTMPSVAADAPLLRCEVWDTGIGMSEAQVASLFRAFEQLDVGSTRRFGGTGLGLIISKRLAELMGGRIGVTSQLGRGSQFWVEIPLHHAAAPVSPLDANDELLMGLQLLVVEDHAASREVLVRQLDALGSRVSAVDSGEAALEALVRADRLGDPHRLLLIDATLPRMSGLETAARIRALPLARPPELVLLMAYDAAVSGDERRRAGVGQLLLKPVTPTRLQDALHAACRPQGQQVADLVGGQVPDQLTATATDTAAAPAPDATAEAPDPEHAEAIRVVLTRLNTLLLSNDTAVNDVFSSAEVLLIAALGEDARRLGRQITDYDYPLALDTLAAIRQRLELPAD